MALRTEVTNVPKARGLLGADCLSYSMPRQLATGQLLTWLTA